MGARSRSAYGSGNASLALFRSILGWCGMALLSFGLGFFVVARLWPAEAGAGADQVTGASAPAATVSNTQAPAPKPQETAPTPPRRIASAVPPVSRTAIVPGPSLDPVPSENEGNAQSNGLGGPDDTVLPGQAAGGDGSPADLNGAAAADQTGVSRAEVRRHRRRRHHADAAAQPSAADDALAAAERETSPTTPPAATADAPQFSQPDTAPADQPTPDAVRAEPPADMAPAAARPKGLYRVQLGTYSTRGAADAEAAAARGKGIKVSVHVFTKDGRTYYRVQHGLYRSKGRADTAKQRAADAGLDATIVPPAGSPE